MTISPGLFIVLTGAGSSASGSVTADTTPNAFSFTDATGAALSSTVTSNTLTLAGTDGSAPISVTGGLYQINGGSFTSAPGLLIPGGTFAAQGTSSGSYSTPVSVVVTIGGVSDTFSITTLADPAAVADAPTLDWTSDGTDSTPDFDVTLPTGFGNYRDAAVNDVLRIEYSPGNTYLTRTLISGDLLGSAISLSASALADGTYAFRARLERSGVGNSAWSADETVTLGAGTNAFLLMRNGTDQVLLRDNASQVILGHITAATDDILLRDNASFFLARNNTDHVLRGH